jgi:radical SAM protein with 4Fe4S-binding SPASM domain
MGDCACDVSIAQLGPDAALSVVYLELTPACNNACPGCSNVFAHAGLPAPLSADGWGGVLARLAPYRPRLRFTGGEPTRYPEFEQILRLAQVQGFAFSVFTNARWQEPERTVRFLAGMSGLECILVSLHGARAESHEAFTGTPGSFAETVANIRRAADAGIPVSTSTVITGQNYTEVPDIIALGRGLGAGHAVFNRYIGPPLPGLAASQAELRIAVREVEQQRALSGNGRVKFGTPIPHCFEPNSSNGCMAGFAHVTIDPWGNVRPCPHTLVIAGNLLDDEDLEAILHSAAAETWRAGYLAQCEGCSSNRRCFAGCRAMALARDQRCDPLIEGV